MDRESLLKGVDIWNGTARIVVSDDFMTAMLYEIAGGDDGSEPSCCEQELKELGIVHGILPVPQPMEDHWVVATGTDPVPGVDGRIEVVLPDESLPKDENDRTGTIDPREQGLIVNVTRGSVVARNIPPTKGLAGKNVFGEDVPSESGKWAVFNAGEGVDITEGGDCLTSRVSGRLFVDGDRISVLEDVELDGIDMSTGHVRFIGRTLAVKESVSGGFKVSVKGELQIDGNIEDDAYVQAGGSITVGGLIRAAKTVVKAGEDLTCSSVEYATIEAGKDVHINDYMLDASCIAGRDVFLESGKGLVAGGKVRLGGSFTGLVVGTPANVPTMIHAGFNPRVKDMHDSVVEELEDMVRKREELQGALDKLITIEKRHGLSEKFQKLKLEIEKGISNINRAREEKKVLLEELEAQIGALKSATITVKRLVYPNTVIRIANASMVLKKEVEAVRFMFRDGQVVLTTIT